MQARHIDEDPSPSPGIVSPRPQVYAASSAHPTPSQQPAKHKGGKWYFAATGHAVYCYGPVMTMPQAPGVLLKVATFCRGDQIMVPLKD